MKRNKNFYKKQKVKEYFLDITTHPKKNFLNYINNFEISLLKEDFGKDIRRALVIGMGYGREIDWLKKIYLGISIDVIDYSDYFLNFGRLNYKKVNFFKIDLNSINNNFDFSKYDLIVSFNTIDYLTPDTGKKLIANICRRLKKNSIFLFRLQSKNFFMAPIARMIMSQRKKNMAIHFMYDIEEIMQMISKNNTKIFTIKQPILLEGLDFLYSHLWNFFSYFELLIRLMIPAKYCRALYIKFVKY
jgi:hypothetical protein